MIAAAMVEATNPLTHCAYKTPGLGTGYSTDPLHYVDYGGSIWELLPNRLARPPGQPIEQIQLKWTLNHLYTYDNTLDCYKVVGIMSWYYYF